MNFMKIMSTYKMSEQKSNYLTVDGFNGKCLIKVEGIISIIIDDKSDAGRGACMGRSNVLADAILYITYNEGTIIELPFATLKQAGEALELISSKLT